MVFQTIEPTIWKPSKDGDKIEGVLVRKNPQGGKYNNESYNIDTGNGLFVVFGTTVLEQRMMFCNVGDMVRITYKGTEKNKKKQDTKIFNVEVDR